MEYNDYLTEVEKDGQNLQFVPWRFRDKAMCDAAIREGIAAVIADIPEELRTVELCRKALAEDGEYLQAYFPEDVIRGVQTENYGYTENINKLIEEER